MAELFVELFSEEIPAKLQIDARQKIKQIIDEKLKKKEIKFKSSKSFSTPKRLVFVIDGIPEKIEQKKKIMKGPKVNAPQSALDGFMKSNNINKTDIYKKTLEKGEFYFAETKSKVIDTKIVGITGAMPSGTGMDIFGKKFPDRMFDVGIAEQHAVTFAAGLATEGYKPFVAIYSTFLQRAYDQVVHDVAIQNLPVRFAIDRAGLVGADGPTHAGAFDITYLSTLPNFVVMGASDEAELVRMINTAVSINDKPCAFRYPRGNGLGVELPGINEILEIGKGKIVKDGNKVAILSFGGRLQECLKAASKLDAKGISTTVADARFAKPLDQKLIMDLCLKHEVLITIEEGSIGGFGSHVFQMLSERGFFDKGLKIRSMVLPDQFLDQDTPESMYKTAGLDAQAIEQKAIDTLKSNIVVPKNKKFS